MSAEIIDLNTYNRAHDVRVRLRDAAHQVQSGFATIADLLYEAWDNKYYRHWGYSNFHSFAEKELDIKGRKADFLVSTAKTLKRLGIPWDKVEHIGWRKLGTIASQMNEENHEELLELAEKNTQHQLAHIMRAKREGTEIVADPPKRLMVELPEEEHSIVQTAIEEAMKLDGVSSKARAITYICYEWYMSQQQEE
jgi:hypothetical protein